MDVWTHVGFVPAKDCEETRDVFATFGEEVTLQVSVVETALITQILWVTFRGVHFATSNPGGSFEIREDFYADRINASSDGSLIIKNLKMEDGGIVKASIYLSDGEDCSQAYNLSITGKCGESRKVSAQVGGNVTLQVEESHIKNLFWERPVGVNFAKTKPGGYIDLRGRQNNSRLQGSPDGSLIINNLSAPDQGDYKAIIFPPDGVGCAQMFNVTISDDSSNLREDISMYVISGIITGVVALSTLCLIYFFWKKKKMPLNVNRAY
ncbi:uncharacterized protein LOC142664716 isoform X2 [Rhinoderma darwinii]|uniref:uncharacterized protein LOC142664716 isoform X2 n=1 Tax=Rhinoderma darwinii TaxID=43563 RepID=UPI003F676922